MKYSLCTEMLYEKLDFIEQGFRQLQMTDLSMLNSGDGTERDWNAVVKAVRESGVKISAFSGDDDFSPIDADEKADYLNFFE